MENLFDGDLLQETVPNFSFSKIFLPEISIKLNFLLLEAFLYKIIDLPTGKERSVVRALKGKLSKTCEALGVAMGETSLGYNASLRAVNKITKI